MTRSTRGRAGFWKRWRGAATPLPAAPRAPVDESLAACQEGRYADAERLLVGELKRAERQVADAPEVVRLLAHLADVYRVQARYDEAEPLFRRAIDLAEARHGSEHPELVRALNNLALVYRAQGEYERAEPLCRRALTIAEKTHGSEHPGTVAPLSNLLTVYLAQGRYREADPLFRRSVAIKERVLGPRNPALASSLANYAAFLRKTRGESAAASWEARAKAIRGRRQATNEH